MLARVRSSAASPRLRALVAALLPPLLPTLLAALLASCASSSGAPEVPDPRADAVCKQLAPRAAPAPPAAPAAITPARPSRLIVEARLPLARLAAELEQAVPPRIAEESGRRIGPAGVLQYSVDRGAFALSSGGGQLVIEAPLQGRAEACSGRRCYAACEPRALARVAIPLWLRPDYRFAPSRLTLDFTRGCKVRALGGLFSVDVTPLLKSAIAPRLERVRREIDARLPDPRAHVERAWQQLRTPRALPLVGCVQLAPLGLVQGPMTESNGLLQARFALLAQPELRGECGSAPAARAELPPLSADPALPAEEVVSLGMEVPLARLARAFEAATRGAGRGAPLQITRATIAAEPPLVAAELALAGELCGSVTLRARPTFSGEEGVLTLGAGQLDAEDSARVRAAGADPEALARALSELPRLASPLPLSLLRGATPALTSLFSDPELALSARSSELRAAGATTRAESIVAWVEARGGLLLEPRAR